MGLNNFIALAPIPAGTNQPSESAAVDLYAVVPPNGFSASGISVILGGDFEGTIAILGSLNGVDYAPVTPGFTAGKQTDPSRPRSIEFPAQLIANLVRYVKWKVLPNTRVFSQVSITMGGSLNCDCDGGGGFPGYGASVLPVAAANVVGVSALVARADHQHEGVHSNVAGTGISVSSATGDVTVTNTSPGLASLTSPLGSVTIGGTLTAPTLETTYGAVGAIAQIDIGDAASAGVANTAARADHQHAIPGGGIPPTVAAAGAVGVATTPARSDHTHEGVAAAVAGAGISVSSATGSVTITNTQTAGLSSLTSPLGSVTIGGTLTAPTLETTYGAVGAIAQIDIGDAASAGVVNTAARADHQHAIPGGVAPPGVDSSSQVGVATTPARSDHTHVGVGFLSAGTGISVSGGGVGAVTVTNTSPGLSSLTSPLGSVTIGGTLTAPTLETTYGAVGAIAQIDIGDTASAGVANTAARADHQHAIPGGSTPPAIASAGAVGVATTPARSDHTHAGVTSVATNGGAAGQGAVTITSPMATQTGSAVTIANANTKTLPGSPVSADINTDTNTGFIVVKLAAGATTIPIPNAPTGNTEGRKITFKITSRGTSTDTVTWTTGAGGYLFALILGPTSVDFDNLLAATPNNGVIKIGFEYDSTLNRWICTALAGYFV